ncbi:retinol dehydrogenase 7-like [Glandiceps talaboti]
MFLTILYYIVYLIVFITVYQLLQWLVRKPTIRGIPDKYVLITGCDRGFGNMLTKRLDKTGFHVFATCLSQQGCKALDEDTSSRVVTLQMDVTNTDSIKKTFQKVQDFLPSGKGLWGLVNNAGILGLTGPYEWLTKEDFQQVIDVNLLGMIDVTNVFLPLIKKSKGRIVNVASAAGRLPIPGAFYSITKYGVEAYSDGLRIMLHPFGIRIQIIEPGFFKTDIINEDHLTKNLTAVYNKQPKNIKDDYGKEYVTEWVTNSMETITKFSSPRTDTVVNAMEHALTSWWPRTRYVIGVDANFFVLPTSFLPAAISDFILRASIKAPIPASCK